MTILVSGPVPVAVLSARERVTISLLGGLEDFFSAEFFFFQLMLKLEFFSHHLKPDFFFHKEVKVRFLFKGPVQPNDQS